jgi:hypothetical protein
MSQPTRFVSAQTFERSLYDSVGAVADFCFGSALQDPDEKEFAFDSLVANTITFNAATAPLAQR